MLSISISAIYWLMVWRSNQAIPGSNLHKNLFNNCSNSFIRCFLLLFLASYNYFDHKKAIKWSHFPFFVKKVTRFFFSKKVFYMCNFIDFEYFSHYFIHLFEWPSGLRHHYFILFDLKGSRVRISGQAKNFFIFLSFFYRKKH